MAVTVAPSVTAEKYPPGWTASRLTPAGAVIEQLCESWLWPGDVTTKIRGTGEQEITGGVPPSRIETVPSCWFTTARSTRPSPLKSAATIATGATPVLNV